MHFEYQVILISVLLTSLL